MSSVLNQLKFHTTYGLTHSLRASSPIWASETSLARTRERAAKPRGAEERRACGFLGNRARYDFIELDMSTGLDKQIDLGKPS